MKFILLLFCLPVLADYAIDSDLELVGDGTRHFHLVLREVDIRSGRWAEISSNDVTLKVNLFQPSPSKYAITTEIVKKEVVLGKPIIVTKLGRTEEVEEKNEDGSLKFRLKVTPTEIHTER